MMWKVSIGLVALLQVLGSATQMVANNIAGGIRFQTTAILLEPLQRMLKDHMTSQLEMGT